MMRWLANWASQHAPTPEKQAERALNNLRMELFQAEQLGGIEIRDLFDFVRSQSGE